ncbi:biotin--[acetyl-CoA-carboxylase] ligase [Paenibacillus yanchengensis]|uniref:Bifunctional ligase/repressor BirA n=1 Tax=Paenibacillus yanchengensis TaxID=2035833 RepID=A0ABW4YJW1_9BACL
MLVSSLLDIFKSNPNEYLSGTKLSELLGVSRTAIWKQIRKLEAEGYEFEASTKLGYKLMMHPSSLDRDLIAKQLHTKTFGQQINVYPAVDSTQNVAREAAEQGAPEGTLFIAEQQLSGRGRMGRQWVSPAGKGIYLSMILRPNVAIPFAPQLTLLTAVALCRSLRTITALPIGIKWPNDLLIGQQKISGILLESATEDTRIKYIIAGIGISVNLTEKDYTEQLLVKATSLRLAAGKPFDRATIVGQFLLEWEQLYESYLAAGFQAIIPIWEALSVSLGKPTTITTHNETIVATPIGLDESGAIRIQLEDGSERAIFSAEMGQPNIKK